MTDGNVPDVDTSRSQVRSAIDAYIVKPIYATGKDVAFLLEPNARKPRTIHKWVKGLEGSFGWVAGDPSSEKVKRASRLLYESQAADGGVCIPAPGNVPCIRLLEKITTSSPHPDIFLIGARGSGKSSAQNDLINNPEDNLFVRGFTFFRADVAKLHHFNVEKLDVPDKLSARMTIAEYMMVHAFFVAFRKGNTESADPAMRLFAEDALAARGSRFSPPAEESPFLSWIEQRTMQSAGDYKSLWASIVQAYRGRVQNTRNDSDLYTFLIKWRQIETQSRSLLPDLFEIFLEFIVGVDGYDPPRNSTARIVLIVDGVDNLRVDEYRLAHIGNGAGTSREWYGKYLEDLKRMTEGGMWPNLARKTVFAIRPDTAEDLETLGAHVGLAAPGGLASSRDTDSVILVGPPDIDLMTKRKREAARDRSVEALFIEGLGDPDASKSTDYTRQVPEMHRWFDLFVPLFISVHNLTLKQCELPHGSARHVLRIVFNDNVRSYSRNLIYTFSAVYDAAFDSCRGQHITAPNMRDQEFIATAKAIAFEVSVTAGASYFPENNDDKINGRWCPNLFDFVLTSGESRWNGLVLLRVLQTLPDINSTNCGLTTLDIVDLLATMKYPKVLVERALLYAHEFGLICKRNTELSTQHRIEIRYERTEKGVYIQRLPFYNAAVLYLMSTGCRFAPGESPPPKRMNDLIAAHWIHDRAAESRAFWAAALKSGTYLLRHILSAHTRDKAIAGKDIDGRFSEVEIAKVLGDLTNGAAGLKGSPGIESVLLALKQVGGT